MQRPGRRGWICGGFCGALWCGAGADVVRRGGGGGGGVMWGWLVRMTKEMGRGWQWPSPEATRCLSLHPPGACVDVVCTAAMCVVTQQLRVSLQLREDGGGSAACCLVEASKGREKERARFVWHGALSGSQQKAKKANANRRIQKNLAICEPNSVARSCTFSGDLLGKFSSVSRHMLIRV